MKGALFNIAPRKTVGVGRRSTLRRTTRKLNPHFPQPLYSSCIPVGKPRRVQVVAGLQKSLAVTFHHLSSNLCRATPPLGSFTAFTTLPLLFNKCRSNGKFLFSFLPAIRTLCWQLTVGTLLGPMLFLVVTHDDVLPS